MTERLPADLSGIGDTIIGFYRALDLREEPAEAFFAPDGIWVRLGQPLQGRDAIRGALQARDSTRVTCHLVANIRTRAVSADRAVADYFVTAYEGLGEVPLRLVAILSAHDELRLIDGRWKIAHKHSRRHLPVATA